MFQLIIAPPNFSATYIHFLYPQEFLRIGVGDWISLQRSCLAPFQYELSLCGWQAEARGRGAHVAAGA
jgi:hypothetical protein